MNIIKSLADLLYEADTKLSPRQKDDRFVLEMAIIVTLFSPLFSYFSSSPYQGDLPPVAPIIREVGTFITKECSKQTDSADFCGFRSSDGKIFPVEYIKEYSSIKEFIALHGNAVPLRVDGFYLLNGKGGCWLIKVSTLTGEELLSEIDSYSKLKSMRGITFLLPGLYLVAVVLWSISIRSALRFSMRNF
ncbi:hypothetical protein [Paraburkholderia ginsengisoli]|uniref:Uncharacterized protein n=1 Tax=Paraburkholderia ginsengisoli TaxID=311231 RepID=A0A7T4N434_9BURK|nr:hypothetical protein [Paraburkholderia ginsengisoli]QQC64887.1 hypothetical protein I6I06_05270 [Paraburkholderia ginsengisoli]